MPSSWTAAAFCIRNGGKPPAGAGLLQLASSSALDTMDAWCAYKVSGSWATATLTMTGTTPVFGGATLDSATDFLIVWDSVPAGNVSVLIDGEKVAECSGSAGYGNQMVSTLFRVAVASAQDADLSSADRLTAPGSIGSFGRATFWTGEDTSIAIPGTDLDTGHYIGYVVECKILADLPKPPGNQLVVDVDLLGDPSTTLDADLIYYFGADANPTNDTDPVGGAIDTGTPANELTANNLFNNLRITGSTVTYYAVAYRQNEAA